MHKNVFPCVCIPDVAEMKPKPELVRVVKAPTKKDEQGNILAAGEISWMQTAKSRGAVHVCKKQTA